MNKLELIRQFLPIVTEVRLAITTQLLLIIVLFLISVDAEAKYFAAFKKNDVVYAY